MTRKFICIIFSFKSDLFRLTSSYVDTEIPMDLMIPNTTNERCVAWLIAKNTCKLANCINKNLWQTPRRQKLVISKKIDN